MAGTTDGTAAVRSVPTREAVLGAALEVFAQQTFTGTPIAAVAEGAGVAAGTIYRHFPSKEALGNAVYQRWKGRMLEYLVADVPRGEPVGEAFRRLWRSMLAFANDHPTAFAFLEHQQHEAYLDAASRALSDRVLAVAIEPIVRGQATGEVRPGDPAVLMALVYGAFVGLSKAVRSGAEIDPADLVAAEDAVWSLLAA